MPIRFQLRDRIRHRNSATVYKSSPSIRAATSLFATAAAVAATAHVKKNTAALRRPVPLMTALRIPWKPYPASILNMKKEDAQNPR